MASSSDFASRFNEDKFRSAIRNAMLMGMPEADADKLKWFWRRDKEFVAQDRAKRPYNFNATPVTNDPGNPDIPDTDDDTDQYLTVDYALEFSPRPAGSVSTVLGEIDASLATVTLFDVDFEKIKTADYAMLGNSRYRIQFAEPAQGMFAVTMHTVLLIAEDQAS